MASPTKKRKKPAPRRWILADVLLTLGMVLERASHAGAKAAETDFHFALVDYRLSNSCQE